MPWSEKHHSLNYLEKEAQQLDPSGVFYFADSACLFRQEHQLCLFEPRWVHSGVHDIHQLLAEFEFRLLFQILGIQLVWSHCLIFIELSPRAGDISESKDFHYLHLARVLGEWLLLEDLLHVFSSHLCHSVGVKDIVSFIVDQTTDWGTGVTHSDSLPYDGPQLVVSLLVEQLDHLGLFGVYAFRRNPSCVGVEVSLGYKCSGGASTEGDPLFFPFFSK